ncbi:adenosylcobinamide-phosphate synthase CbiB [Synechococcus sp. CCY9202]|uniref:adenosylcobinamide-phosphate synthase CbiB n=1 Tax=Synechococcus sp. CCY9202 TaxID=174698 RepID=UPI002B21AD66|nr:adenosylcobinamide-phosphate synthase CbiB [Synechococcus sp. CCY9202]MEA5422169.1 adenosylcobinamide-phosphate synthase CbiB [Synechococcus sp. CCY9202]
MEASVLPPLLRLVPLAPMLAVLAGVALDRLVGDPQRWLHPVQVIGWGIGWFRRVAEDWAGDRPGRLRLAGTGLTLLVVGLSGLAGWQVERLTLVHPVALPLLVIALASALAGRSLEQAVQAVVAALPPFTSGRSPADLELARQRLAWIVGRDVDGLCRSEILRAAAETASENAVDGVFAPLFWMLLGALLWCAWPDRALVVLPGPLCLAWSFKAASTLDSMLGYRQGRLRWLGTAGARLDDLLTWLPCRLVALSLPLAAGRPGSALVNCRRALLQGRPDPSPNAGVSQAAYALAADVHLGGLNHYGGLPKLKPVLHAAGRPADALAVTRMLQLTRRLTGLWLLSALAIALALGGCIDVTPWSTQ